jgi:hypothetical protein
VIFLMVRSSGRRSVAVQTFPPRRTHRGRMFGSGEEVPWRD